MFAWRQNARICLFSIMNHPNPVLHFDFASVLLSCTQAALFSQSYLNVCPGHTASPTYTLAVMPVIGLLVIGLPALTLNPPPYMTLRPLSHTLFYTLCLLCGSSLETKRKKGEGSYSFPLSFLLLSTSLQNWFFTQQLVSHQQFLSYPQKQPGYTAGRSQLQPAASLLPGMAPSSIGFFLFTFWSTHPLPSSQGW